MLSVKKIGLSVSGMARKGGVHLITCIEWIKLHGLKSFMLLQYSAGPFPHSTQFPLPTKLAAVVDDGNWMPVSEAHVRVFEVNEVRMRIKTSSCTGDTVNETFGWRRLFNAVIDEVA